MGARGEVRARSGPGTGILTDTAPQVAALALQVCQELLTTGTLALAPVQVRLCLACDHMTGEVDHDCRVCTTGAGTRPALRQLLLHDRPGGRPVLEQEDFHANRASMPAHLVNIAHNAPQRLLLSRPASAASASPCSAWTTAWCSTRGSGCT
ncbi:hypothetical protein [Streptomyces angustmyceticus]|uniref:hypothetical protein n=1 Tax=Streptomyces angustmyceticus TaxID=285578 RepID=UPI00380C38C6